MAATNINTVKVTCPICDEVRDHPETTACMLACPECMRALIMIVNGLMPVSEAPPAVQAAIEREING